MCKGENIVKDISSEIRGLHIRFTLQRHTYWGELFSTVVQRIEISQILVFAIWEQKFQTFPINVHLRFTPQNLCTLLGMIAIKILFSNVKFGIFCNFAFFCFGRFTWYSMEIIKCVISGK